MAAKSKKRLCRNENKLLILEKLEIRDVICSICQSILIEPVTLPCYHDFCQRCFNGSIENNALCCPLCRLRIGSWVRTATKQKNLVNIKLWNFIQNKFSQEVDKKVKGEDIQGLSPEIKLPRLSKPGEIRSEYEAELQRLRAERLKLEQKQIQETVVLIKKLKEEEEEAHKKYLESLKQDEMLAKKLHEEHQQKCQQINVTQPKTIKKKISKASSNRSRLKSLTIDSYLSKLRTPVKNSLLTDDTSTDESVLKAPSSKSATKSSPEVHKSSNDCSDKRPKHVWNKENGKSCTTKKDDHTDKEKCNENHPVKTKNGLQSLLVSLPLPATGILQHKSNIVDKRNLETGSVDSMQQELCYFKPIEGTTPTSFVNNRGLPLRVPTVRVDKHTKIPTKQSPPSRAQYIESLCHLRQFSLKNKLPSAFVIALSILQAKKVSEKNSSNLRSKLKRSVPVSLTAVQSLSFKREKNVSTRNNHDYINKLTDNTETFLRRTRSMGSISKVEYETTPKKNNNERKVSSERKTRLRSESKKYSKKDTCSSPIRAESINNNKLRIEKLIQQEKRDYELACKMDAEWNGRRQPRRAATKRQVTLNYALRPAKKVKV
ncbi:uncharacterized protein LOC119830353 isoform X2 [Zerene cesonia]|uniref:uncharacterized protein LOC119830353 isoform X2 n=1 Tax=Zerene cesonia TaxID=33412 RepID=UPI0018E4E1ED|nr:uncharacterized protein LOC119830353 isoform X2 [Zerene cesonia]